MSERIRRSRVRLSAAEKSQLVFDAQEARANGESVRSVAHRVGVHEVTLYSWLAAARRQKALFLPVNVSSAKPLVCEEKGPLSVVLPSGIRIEGVTASVLRNVIEQVS